MPYAIKDSFFSAFLHFTRCDTLWAYDSVCKYYNRQVFKKIRTSLFQLKHLRYCLVSIFIQYTAVFLHKYMYTVIYTTKDK